MKVTYVKRISDQIIEIKDNAAREGRDIDYITLTKKEFGRLIQELSKRHSTPPGLVASMQRFHGQVSRRLVKPQVTEGGFQFFGVELRMEGVNYAAF